MLLYYGRYWLYTLVTDLKDNNYKITIMEQEFTKLCRIQPRWPVLADVVQGTNLLRGVL